MINLVNRLDLTRQERLDSLFRSMHTQPFFNLLTFSVDVGARKHNQWETKSDVNREFYLTEVIGNFDEALQNTGSLFNMSVYASLNNGSVYNFIQTVNLPSGFIASQARSAEVAFANQLFDDRQFEYCPYLIKQGDRLIGRLANVTAKTQGFDINVCLKGYYVTPGRHLNDNTTRGINESLDRPIRFETWREHFRAASTADNKVTYSFKNDRTARMVLGFGVVDPSIGEGLTPSQINVEILDTFRNIKWNNKPMPIEFLGPRIGAAFSGVRDAHIYYIPIEYLWEPFSSLQAMATLITAADATGLELVMLTRTV